MRKISLYHTYFEIHEGQIDSFFIFKLKIKKSTILLCKLSEC